MAAAEVDNVGEQATSGPWPELLDWSAWDRLPWPDEPPLDGPPDPKRTKWGGPCAGPGEDGKGCHARWASLWSGKKGEPTFCKLGPCYAAWRREKAERDAQKEIAGLSTGEKMRHVRKRAREEAELKAELPNPASLSAVAMPPLLPIPPLAMPIGTWEPIVVNAILGQRWKEPSAVEPWERRSIKNLGSGDFQVIAFGKYSEAPNRDSEGVPDAQWRTLAELTGSFGAEATRKLLRKYLADIERAGLFAIDAAEKYATDNVGGLGADPSLNPQSGDEDETETPSHMQQLGESYVV